MAMSDCVKCWETPCACGWGYRQHNKDARLSRAAAMLGIPRELLKELVWDEIPERHPMNEAAEKEQK